MSGIKVSNIKLGPKLIAAYLVIGIVPWAVLSFIALRQSSTALEAQAYHQSQSVRSIKKAQIE